MVTDDNYSEVNTFADNLPSGFCSKKVKKQLQIERIITDIRFWILVIFVIRLIGITNPPLETGHNWRQSTVTMVSRNFYELDNNLFYPRIDIAGDKTGITGMEFPLFNYLIYLASLVFGYEHWYGRLINLIVSSLGLLFFYKLVKKKFSEQISFYSTIVLSVSVWFAFSRKIMPDTFAMSLIIASIYYGVCYFEVKSWSKKIIYLLIYIVLMALGGLSKLPVVYLLIVFAMFIFNRKIIVQEKLVFILSSFAGLIPIIYWYFFWVPYLVKEYDFWHFFMGKNFVVGIREIIENLPQTFNRFYFTALKFTGFAAFLFGLIFSIIKKDKKILILFSLTFLSFCAVIFKAGFAFPHHNYYIIPFVPVMALIAGYGLSQIKNLKIVLIALIVISIEGIADQQHDCRIKKDNLRLINLEKDLDKFSNRNDLIIINSGSYPTPMYFAHRKGWINTNEMIENQKYINELVDRGLKYIVILKKSFGKEIVLEHYKKEFDNEDYCIYKGD